MTRLVALLALLAFAFVLSGCHDHLAGTHDAQLDYQVAPDPESAQSAPSGLAAQAVKWRLIAAQVTADVEAVGADRVRVTIDQDYAEFADDLLHWRGGVAIYRVDPSFNFSPPDGTELAQKSEPGEAGATERYWVGDRARISTAVHAAKLAKGHLAFSERGADNDTWRTRVTFDPPLADMFGKTEITKLENADRGRSLAMTFTAEGAAALGALTAKFPDAQFAIVRGRSLMATVPASALGRSPLVIPFGTDIYSYTYAHANKRLITGGTLPPLRRVAAAPLPVAWGPAIACIVLPLLCSLGWLFFVRQFDRGRPEPWWLVLATFALGGLGVIPAAFAEYALQSATPYLSPSVMSLGGQLMGFPLDLVVFTIVVGVVEEGVKFLGAWSLARHRKEFDEPVDGIVYGCASALGFAAIENVKYFASTRLSGGVVTARVFLSVPAHMFFGAVWGYALGRKLVNKKTSVLLWFLLAATLHGAFDTFLTIDGLQILSIVLNVGLGFAFVWFLRKSLRYGAIAPDVDSPASSARAFYRMGSTARFFVFTGLLVLLAALLMSFGATYEIFKHRVGFVFIGIASMFLVLFGVVAYFLTDAVPLDAAVDALGVTFAGTTTRWGDVLRVERSASRGLFGARAWLRLHTARGSVHVGPCDPATADRLHGAVQSYGSHASGVAGVAAVAPPYDAAHPPAS